MSVEFSILGELRRLPATAVLAAFATMATGFALPFFAEAFINDVLADGRVEVLWLLVAGMAATAVLRSALTWVQRAVLLRHQMGRAAEAGERLVRAVLAADMGALNALGPGDVASRLRLHDRAWRLFLGDLVHRIVDLPALPVFFGLMLWFDPVLALATLVLTAINAGAVVMVGAQRRRIGDRLALARGRLAGLLVRDIDAMPMIKAGVLEDSVFSRWLWAQRRQRRAAEQLGRLSEALAVVPGLVSGVSLAAILGAGAWRIMEGELTVGGLVACQTLFFSINDVVRRFIEAGGQLEDLASDLRRGGALSALPASPRTGGAMENMPEPADGSVAATGVPVANRLLEARFEAGSQTAIVGPSGCGKTRVCRVLAGLDGAAPGRVTVGGVDVAALPRAQLARTVVLVSRTLTALSGSVRDVVTFWDRDAEEEAVRRALAAAAVDDVVAALPERLDTVLGSQGVSLSGGQNQRLAIARAFLQNPRVMVLDEALEALDAALARRIVGNLRAAGITGIVVTHRADVLNACDAVLDLGGGDRHGGGG